MMSPTPTSSAFRRPTFTRTYSSSSLAGKTGGGTSSSSPSVILEFGSSYIRVGYSTSPTPRVTLPSTLPFPRPNATSSTTTEEEWENLLYPLLSDIYTSSLYLKQTKARRVLILEPYVSPTSFRVAVCRVLLCRLNVSSILFVPGGCMNVIPYGLGSGDGGEVGGGNKVIVDVGTWECRVVGCVDTSCLVDTFQAVPCGFDSFVQYVMNEHNNHMKNKNDEKEETSRNLIPTIQDARYIVTKCLNHLSPLSSSTYNNDGEDEVLTMHLQSSTSEPIAISTNLVKQCIHELYLDVTNPDSLAYAFLSTLIKCPIDLRRSMSSSIIMVGGGVLAMPGLERLFGKAMIRAYQEKEYYEKMDSTFQPLKSVILKSGDEGEGGLGIIYPLSFAPHQMSFVGGCIMGTLDLMEERWIYKRIFEEVEERGNDGMENVIHDFLSVVTV